MDLKFSHFTSAVSTLINALWEFRMNYWTEFDFQLGILLKHRFRERILRQHESLWQLLTSGVAILPLFPFLPSSFRLGRGALRSLCKAKDPKPIPGSLGTQGKLPQPHCSTPRRVFFSTVPLFHTCECVFPSALLILLFQQPRAGSKTGPKDQLLWLTPVAHWAGLSEPSHRCKGCWTGKHLGEEVIGSSSNLMICTAKSCLKLVTAFMLIGGISFRTPPLLIHQHI